MLKTILKPFASLTLTVILLAFSMVLIYAGTWAQIDSGIWQVQSKYFHHFFCWIDFQTLWPRPKPGQPSIPGGFPMLGGYSIGVLLLINLLAAHTVRFKFVVHDLFLVPLLGLMIGSFYLWHQNPSMGYIIASLVVGLTFLFVLAALHGKRTGIILIHIGLIVLLAGEGITSGLATESQMTIDVGSYGKYSQDIREPELAIVRSLSDTEDAHVVVAARVLEAKGTIKNVALPFDITVDDYYRNSSRNRPSAAPSKPTISDSDGTWTVLPEQEIGGVVGNKSDAPSTFVTLSRNGRTIGSYLFSLWNDKPQQVSVDGKTYGIALRFKRIYHPYTIKLQEFVHDNYTGTDVAKDFAARVILEDPAHHEHREVRIWMNNPLRYRGDTIYQSGFKPGDHATILQIVHNPGAIMPYVAIIITTVGLLLHFGIALASFLLRSSMSTREFLIGAGAITLLALGSIPGYFILGLFWTWTLFGGAIMLAIVAMLTYHVATRQPPREESARTGRTERRATAERGRREIAPDPRFLKAAFIVPALVTLVFAIFALSQAVSAPPKSEFDLDSYAKLPISFEGRIQPIDTLARNALKVISGYDTTTVVEGEKERRISAVEWYLDISNDREAARKYKIFRIDHPEVKDLIGLAPKEKYFSLDQIVANDPEKVQVAIRTAMEVSPGDRSVYQRKLSELGEKINYFMNIQRIAGFTPPPDAESKPSIIHAGAPLNPGQSWTKLIDLMKEEDASGSDKDRHPSLTAFAGMQRAVLDKTPAVFNRVVSDYSELLNRKLPDKMTRTAFETWFNRFDPVFICWIVYVGVFVFAFASWIGWTQPLRKTSLWLLGLALIIHTIAIFARVYISERPPVTNLANSAIFIGFGAALFGAALELIFPRGIGAACAGIVGFITLLIYHELALDGDTMKVLVAVLDTNIWLATHVIAVTLGYSATFLSAILGVVYILRGVFSTDLDADARKSLGRMMYGITCFAMLFSFIGTILGGIWADQSWGRFWGWGPEENGAILIVLANAIVLHARWGGLVRDRGIAVLAVCGAIVTAWSWFGTNMLGVGLHSYGFMDAALAWLLAAVGALLLIVGIGLVPTRNWRSFQDELKPRQPIQPIPTSRI